MELRSKELFATRSKFGIVAGRNKLVLLSKPVNRTKKDDWFARKVVIFFFPASDNCHHHFRLTGPGKAITDIAPCRSLFIRQIVAKESD